MTDAVEQPAKPRRFLWRALRVIGLILLWGAILLITAWTALAVCFTDLSGGRSPRRFLAIVVAIVMLATVLFIRPRRFRLAGFAVLFVLVVIWFFTRQPSNTRDWQVDVSLLPWASIDGDQVTVHNIRNFDYRSETDFTPAWYDRTFDLNKLKTADFMLCYWGSKAIAHGIVSFDFGDGQFLAVSIETRKEKGESYSAVEGFFRQYELIYVFADERDVVRLRTNHRHEDVYLYHTRVGPAEARAAFLSYVEKANALREHPTFYNALTTNCVTSIIPHARAGRPSAAPLSWELIFSGYVARRAYKNNNLDTSVPFEQLEARSRINDAAIAADDRSDFSTRIRAGLPRPATR